MLRLMRRSLQRLLAVLLAAPAASAQSQRSAARRRCRRSRSTRFRRTRATALATALGRRLAVGRPTRWRPAALGITLQAWEQWEAAHAAYQRAQALAPEAADWRYLDGMVLQRLVRHAEAAERSSGPWRLRRRLLTARARLAEALFDAGDARRPARGAYDALGASPPRHP